MRGGRVLFFVGFAVVAAAAVAAYGVITFEQPPGFSELPGSWFVRPATAKPADWRMRGVTEVRIETSSGANLEVIPEDRQDVAASLKVSADAPLTPLAGGANNAFMIAGDPAMGCPARPLARAPTLIVRTPRAIAIRAKGPFAASVGPAERLLIDSDGCGAWKIASAQTLWLAERNGGQAEVGPIDDLRLARWGKGADRFESVDHAADLIVHGAGSVIVAKAAGIVDAAVWGAGRVDLGQGFVGRERIWIKGPGQVLHRGEAGEITGEARLKGKIRVRQARGVITGVGDVQVGRPNSPVTGF